MDENKKRDRLYKLIMILLLIVVLLSGYRIADYYITSAQEKAAYGELDSKRALIDDNYYEESTLQFYKEMYDENNDFWGWITIPSTNINYPVMYSPNSGDYYLYRNYKKESASSGSIYIDDYHEETSSNMIVHGHNMRDGSMFADLDKYKDESFFLDNKIIRFDSMDEIREYEVISVLIVSLLSTDDDFFDFFQYGNITDEKSFNEYMGIISSMEMYDSGVTATFGDNIITMSTCLSSDTHAPERFLVVAKKITP